MIEREEKDSNFFPQSIHFLILLKPQNRRLHMSSLMESFPFILLQYFSSLSKEIDEFGFGLWACIHHVCSGLRYICFTFR